MRTRFQEYRDGLIHAWLAILTALGFCLIPLFLVLDHFTMPAELQTRFAVYRGLATAANLLQYFWVKRTRPSRFSYLHGYLFTLVVSGMITWMTVDLGGFNSAYYAGLNLVVVAANMLLPWRAIHSAINGLLVMVMYVVANAIWGGLASQAIVINNLYFMGATLVIAVAITYSKHQLIEKEFSLRAELLDVNANLDRSRQELKAARDALWGEMEVAKRIQTALLPRSRRLGPFEVNAVMQTAAEVGGDYYDFFETRTGEQWVAIGDVSGHGVESGLVMMMTQTSISSMVNDIPGKLPSAVFRSVNTVLRENISRLQTSRYMTLNVIRVREDRLTVAGKHQDILIWRQATGRVELVTNRGCWIGVVPDVRGFVEDEDIMVGEGDLVLLFTDGVTEATSPGGEMFGDERLAQALGEVATLPLDQALSRLLETVNGFQEKQDDDITLLLMRRLPAAARSLSLTARAG